MIHRHHWQQRYWPSTDTILRRCDRCGRVQTFIGEYTGYTLTKPERWDVPGWRDPDRRLRSSMNICTCDTANYVEGTRCALHVECDEDCRALEDPHTLDEYERTLTHWRDHSWQAGCSHGC